MTRRVACSIPQSRGVGITREGVAVRTSEGVDMVLPQGDPCFSLGLAYAINMHQARA
jgi:hypothetical protein